MFLSTLLINSAFAGVPVFDKAYTSTISVVESMVRQPQALRIARRNGLSLINVSWEDTGRSKGSSSGPNISDMTIGVRDHKGDLHPMPVLRFDNFSDKSADIRSDQFGMLVGNHSGSALESVSLKKLLQRTDAYLSNQSTIKGSLWRERDEHVLVSAQACFLPIPKHGSATFTPVLYNYQSSPQNPAVMTIVATREGTSVQVIENTSGYLSEVLWFNDKGQRAPFTAMRVSDFRAKGGDETTPQQNVKENSNLNAVLVIQVPLKQRRRVYQMDYGMEYKAAPIPTIAKRSSPPSDIENAVIGHGPTEGVFKELNRLEIERDELFPVRVTVQFYKATSNGLVTNQDIKAMRQQIDRVYEEGDFVGSLVTDGFGARPTEWQPARKDSVWGNPIWSWHKSN